MTEIASTLEMVPITKIRPYGRNPRKNSATIDKLVQLIPKTGFNVPLVLDRSNVIVKGHSRWVAAIRLGLKELPCVYTDADPEAIKLDRLTDNRVQEFSQWDTDLLGSELRNFNAGYDFGLLGWSVGAVPVAEPPAGKPAAAPAAVPPPAPEARVVTCNHCGHHLRVPQ
jgi:hypothetical protein